MIRKLEYVVITKVGEDSWYNTTIYKEGGKYYVDEDREIDNPPQETLLPLDTTFAKAFSVGELLILDKETGREGDWGRKPHKWNVEYRTFTDPLKAARFSNRVIKKKLNL